MGVVGDKRRVDEARIEDLDADVHLHEVVLQRFCHVIQRGLGGAVGRQLAQRKSRR